MIKALSISFTIDGKKMAVHDSGEIDIAERQRPPLDLGAINITMTSKPDPAFYAGIAAMMAPIDARPLFAERDGYRIETAAGAVLFPSMRKCQICWRLAAKECSYKCGAVLCADCGALHDPPDCPPQMAEYLADQERASAEYAEAQGQIMHGIRDAAAEPVTGEGDPC